MTRITDTRGDLRAESSGVGGCSRVTTCRGRGHIVAATLQTVQEPYLEREKEEDQHRQRKEVWDGGGITKWGLGDGSPPAGSRGRAPVGGLEDEVPRS